MTATVPMLRRPNPKHRISPIAPKAHPLARRFFELLEAEGVALTDIAQRAGLHHVTLSKWKRSHAPTVVALEAALNVLGFELRIVRRYERQHPTEDTDERDAPHDDA